MSRADGLAGMLDVLVGRGVGPWDEVSLTTSSGSNMVNHGRRGQVVCPSGRRQVSFWGSAGVICARLWLESCHDGVRRGQVRARRADGCAPTSEMHIKLMAFDDF